MKWNTPSVGDTRYKTRFAFFPITCQVRGYKKETRWLCFVTTYQTWSYEWLDNWFID